ncbi:MAG: hypothetical protein JWO68_186 [Actinomycetia bacterium]|nr:hypothetical protein [Actinomycetes bacterium]
MDDIEAIKQLKARYFRGMDTKQWDLMREVFAPDVHVDMEAEGGGIHTDRDAFMAMLVESIGDVTTVHHGHMPEITITSPTTASGTWAMEDKLRWPEGAPIKAMHGYGHYHETYEKGADGQWRIKTLTLTRLRVDFEMPD